MSRKVIIEFNETTDVFKLFTINSLDGTELNKDLLTIIEHFDNYINIMKSKGINYGYIKTFFKFQENNEILETIRIDLGDGIRVNYQYFKHIKDFIFY